MQKATPISIVLLGIHSGVELSIAPNLLGCQGGLVQNIVAFGHWDSGNSGFQLVPTSSGLQNKTRRFFFFESARGLSKLRLMTVATSDVMSKNADVLSTFFSGAVHGKRIVFSQRNGDAWIVMAMVTCHLNLRLRPHFFRL